MDYNWELGRLKETGKFVIGEKVTAKMLKKGTVQAVVYAEEPHLRERYEAVSTLKFSVPFNSIQLGTIFGKPFPVSVVGVLEPGNSQFKGTE